MVEKTKNNVRNKKLYYSNVANINNATTENENIKLHGNTEKQDPQPKKLPLMRKATAMWLIENTALTFQQIAEFCDIHILEIEGMADGDVAGGIASQSPIDNGQLTRDMIKSCEEDPRKKLEIAETIADAIVIKKGGRKNNTYVPLARRGDKPDGVMYLLKYYPNITDQQIRTLISTTTPVIRSLREKNHWNIKEIKPRDPVILGLCSQTQFNAVVGEIGKTK